MLLYLRLFEEKLENNVRHIIPSGKCVVFKEAEIDKVTRGFESLP